MYMEARIVTSCTHVTKTYVKEALSNGSHYNVKYFKMSDLAISLDYLSDL